MSNVEAATVLTNMTEGIKSNVQWVHEFFLTLDFLADS